MDNFSAKMKFRRENHRIIQKLKPTGAEGVAKNSDLNYFLTK